MLVKIKKLNEDAIVPHYAHPGDAGLDLFALQNDTIAPGEIKVIYFGLAMEFEQGYVAIMKDRSSMGKKGIHNLGGVFDSGYRGEYNCTLINLSDKTYEIKKGDKVTQVVIFSLGQAEIQETEVLSETDRSTGGFGSTGR